MKPFDKSEPREQALITGLFCEMFSAAGAVKELTDRGFADTEIDLIGVLNGSVTDLSRLLRRAGVPAEEVELYSDCFEHGAVLVMVRTLPAQEWRIARHVLKRHGGIFAREI